MKLTNVHVQMFCNILDSGQVCIQEDVTCLVGKNESGKTAFLDALRRLNPTDDNIKFDTLHHYPAWLEKRHRREKVDFEIIDAVTGQFELEQHEIIALAERLGENVIKSNKIIVMRKYGGDLALDFEINERLAVSFVIEKAKLSENLKNSIEDCVSFEELQEILNSRQDDGDRDSNNSAQKLQSLINDYLSPNVSFLELVHSEINRLVPKFFYFSEYSRLPGKVRIRELFELNETEIDESQRTARSLLLQAGAERDYLLDPNYETRKRELENVANSITSEVMGYWTTNEGLRVQIDISQSPETDENNQQFDELHIRMWDDLHMLSLPFEKRSSGFQWFFSFLSAFSEYFSNNSPVVILLDEPGIGLHARAQADFLRFIDERLAQHCQVIYTTHSPFMIQPDKLDRVRVVADVGRQKGTQVSKNVLDSDPDTLFPLQGALGYDLAQHLFIGSNNLVVEGTSDYAYLNVLSSFLIESEREGLNNQWTIIPVGGADLIPTFIALLGSKNLDFTVLVDTCNREHQKLQVLAEKGYLTEKRIIYVGQSIGKNSGEIEDLFDTEDYLKLYNRAFDRNIKRTDLIGSDSIVKQISRKEKLDRFNHGKPADLFLRERVEILPTLSSKTLENFETIFSLVNKSTNLN